MDADNDLVDTAWRHIKAIRHLYSRFAKKRPVMVLDLPSARVYAYPYLDFKRDLASRSRNVLEEQYARAIQSGSMVVFVRDNDRRKLISCNFPLDDWAPNRGAAPARGQWVGRRRRAAPRGGRGG